MKRTTGLVYDPAYLRHRLPAWHPEQPRRLTTIVEHLKGVGLWEQMAHIPARPATEEELSFVHTPAHIAQVRSVCAEGGAMLDDGDTPACRESYEVARLAVGGVLAACDAVVGSAECGVGNAESGKASPRNAFALVRPPGHHARPGEPMGFCIFNNVAIAARYLQRRHGLDRVLIVDWDVHHGNGTQDAFYDDPSVLFVSIHHYPFYPGSGRASEIGAGYGRGATINVPLPGGTGGAAYVAALRAALLPAAERFRPEFVLVSAGFDAHRDDPLGGMELDDSDYGALARLVRGIAEEHCGGRLVAALEGGYDLGALGRSVAEVVRVFIA